MADFHNCKEPITNKIRYLLTSLTMKPSEYDKITPKIEFWIEYVLCEEFTTVDELVEGVSWMVWERGGSYSNVGRFLKEFHDAPSRSEQGRSFVIQLCSHVLRWFAITSVERLGMGSSGGLIASGGGDGFVRAASFVGHLVERGLLSQELVRRHLIKPLINHFEDPRYAQDPVWASAIYQVFTIAGSALVQGLLEPEEVRLSFETLDAQNRIVDIRGYDAARIKVWWTVYAKALQQSLTCESGTPRDSHRLVAAERRRQRAHSSHRRNRLMTVTACVRVLSPQVLPDRTVAH